MFSENAALFEKTYNPCKTSGCSKGVKSPYWFCYNCNVERKKNLTSNCDTCSRAIKPGFPTCYSCFQEKKAEGILAKAAETRGDFDLAKTLDAPAYEPVS